MKEKKSILGRGLDELFESKIENLAPRELSLSQIIQGASQPRKSFDPDKIAQLAESIKDTGLIQPIVVRPTTKHDEYEIVAGERRWLAARQAGLSIVPVMVKSISDTEALKLAIIENIQREDLNVLEEAEAYHRLIQEHQYTQDKIATEVGKSRSHIANTLRLLNLPDEIKDFLISGQMTAGHARALLNDDNAVETAKEIIREHLNVRDVEKKVRQKEGETSSTTRDEIEVQEKLSAHIKGNVRVRIKKNKVNISIEFNDLWDVEDFLNHFPS